MGTFVLVPSPLHVAGDTISSNTGSASLGPLQLDTDYNALNRRTSYTLEFKGALTIDPMHDATLWYGIDGSWMFNSLDSHFISRFLWSAKDFSDFVEAEFEGTVVAQKSPYGWNIYLQRQDDQKFQAWIEEKRKHPHFVVPTTGNDKDRTYYEEWCRETLLGQWQVAAEYQGIVLRARDVADKALIKLRWS